MADHIEAMVDRADQLTDTFIRLTLEQRDILAVEDMDAQALNKSLAARQTVLADMQTVFEALAQLGPEAAAHHTRLREILERAKALDDHNIETAKAQAEALKGQARQMTQTRKGVSGYGRTDLAGTSAQIFDKTQ